MKRVHQDRISTDVDWIGGKLKPLSEGHVVCLSLLNEQGRGKFKSPLIVITPGDIAGFRKKAVVVSVVNIGSCIVEIGSDKTIGLVLAGIPAKYAKYLLDALNRTLGETHGNSTTPRPSRGRYTERARRWSRRTTGTVSTVTPSPCPRQH